jgi:hypothetical protein
MMAPVLGYLNVVVGGAAGCQFQANLLYQRGGLGTNKKGTDLPPHCAQGSTSTVMSGKFANGLSLVRNTSQPDSTAAANGKKGCRVN